jgi:hypothetical protein
MNEDKIDGACGMHGGEKSRIECSNWETLRKGAIWKV